MITCLPADKINLLKAAFAKEGITIEKLSKMSSGDRSEFFKRVLGDEGKSVNVLFEKALVSNQKQAMTNWTWKQFTGHKPLYTNITLQQSKSMVDAGVSAKELKSMTPEQRLTELSKYVDAKVAKTLNERFENSIKSGNLANWEEKTLGTMAMHTDKKLKGAFAKLETLNETGLLDPEQTEMFMKDLVSSKLGVEVTAEQSAKISDMTKSVSTSLDEITKTNDWTANNEKNVIDYFTKRANLEEYVKGIAGGDAVDIANDLVSIARNNILGSPRILRNSALYQIIPSFERFITKRIVSANIGEMNAGFMEQLSAKISSGLKVDAKGRDFIKRQLLMNLKIYNKTGYDMSRMEGLYTDGQMFIGEAERTIGKVSFKDAVGFKGKVSAITNRVARVTGVFPKWFAGGTDTLIAASTRAETAVLWSKEIARLEAKKGLLKGMTEAERANQLLTESYSFDPIDPKAAKIRDMGIMDADFSNNTQPDGLSDFVVKLRDALNIGGVKFGRVLVPFAKISTTSLSRGLQTAIPIGVVKDLRGIYQASKVADQATRSKLFSKYVSSLVGAMGLIGTAILIATMLDDDDYVPPYAAMSFKEYQLARAKGSNPGSIRIGGKWIPLRYLPIVGIPISAIMNARQVKSKGGNPVVGYLQGVIAQLIDLPGVKEISDLYSNLKKTTRAEDATEILNSAGLDGKSVVDWAKVRAIPSFLSYDIYNAVLPDKKYDFLGREIDRGGAFRDDKTNEILIEFSRLDRTGQAPTVADYTGEAVDKAKKKLGEDAYEERVNQFKKNYAVKVERLINQSNYKRMSDENKKKKLNELRTQEIIDKIKKL